MFTLHEIEIFSEFLSNYCYYEIQEKIVFMKISTLSPQDSKNQTLDSELLTQQPV